MTYFNLPISTLQNQVEQQGYRMMQQADGSNASPAPSVSPSQVSPPIATPLPSPALRRQTISQPNSQIHPAISMLSAFHDLFQKIHGPEKGTQKFLEFMQSMFGIK